jgi:CubicO group peptidase (beta-lactamase class C family)
MRYAGGFVLAFFLTVVPLTVPVSVNAEAGQELTLEKVKAALPELEKLAEKALKDSGIPGMAIAVVCKDQPVYLKGFGIREAGKAAPVGTDTIFQIASMSKPIASTVLAVLAGEKVIAWDDRIIDLDPGFRMHDPWVTQNVTLRDMFSHRSGLQDHAGDELEDMGYYRSEILRRLRYLKPGSSFRSHYAYTNFGITEAAVAAARAAGKPWEELSAEKLYKPLGMSSTSSRFDDVAAAGNRALLHVRIDGRWVARHTRNADAQSPAGGVSSAVRDLARWMRLQLGKGKFEGKQLVEADALTETHRPVIVTGPPADPGKDRADLYALGWNVRYDDKGRVILSHSGAFSKGAATTVVLIPSEDLGITILTNAFPIGIPEALACSFIDLAHHGKVERDWFALFKLAFEAMFSAMADNATDYSKSTAQPLPSLPAEAYAGTYRSEYYGDIRISVKEKGLALQLGPQKTLYLLNHYDRDVFTYLPEGEAADSLSGIFFQIGPDRKAASTVVEGLNEKGQGTFIRVPAKE